jgi:hypothetical protein
MNKIALKFQMELISLLFTVFYLLDMLSLKVTTCNLQAS